MTVTALRSIPGERVEVRQPPTPVRPLTLAELFAMDIRPRSMLLSPILPEKGLAMIYSPRGMGKTLLGQSMSCAVASGGTVLRWIAPQARRVLHVDGEMPLCVLRERFANILKGAECESPPENLRLLAADHLDDPLPNLSSPAGQALIESVLDGVSLLMLDNLSTLAATVRDNDADSWSAMQEWLLSLRRRGISVVLFHHAGKGGQQRGTSRREDVLDCVIALRRPNDYHPKEGARFEVHFEKARGCLGDDVSPFEATYEVRDGAAHWTVRDLADVDLARVVSGLQEGLSIREIAKMVNLPKSTVHRLKQKAEQDRLL